MIIKSKIVCHKCGLVNHFAKDCLAEISQKLMVKDSSFYARKSQELPESEKDFVTTVSRSVDGYWSFSDVGEERPARSMCLMARQLIEYDEGNWSSGSEEDDDDAEPNFCNMATNDPQSRSII